MNAPASRAAIVSRGDGPPFPKSLIPRRIPAGLRALLLVGVCAVSASGCVHAPKARGIAVAAHIPAPSGATSFAVLGDFGVDDEHEAAVAALIHSWSPEFVVTLGDNNYPRGEAETLESRIGKYYGDYIEQGAFLPILGNHDLDTDLGAAYLRYFALPGNRRYYTVERGPVAFFAINSDKREPDGTSADSIQAQWLKKAMGESSAPWKVVLLHHPPYSSGRHGSSTWVQWPFAAWGAQTVWSGHDHAYERNVIDGTTYIVNGLGGARQDRFRGVPGQPHATETIGYDKTHGAMRVHADAEHLHIEFIDVAGHVIDNVTLIQPVHTTISADALAPR